jgi:hypothetical protein
VPVAQRLGALLVLDDQTGLTMPVVRWLRDKPLRSVSLVGDLSPDVAATSYIDADFKVRVPADLQVANT